LRSHRYRDGDLLSLQQRLHPTLTGPYGGQEDPLAINLELVLGGLMGTSSAGGTMTRDMAAGVATYLAACGIAISPSQMVASSKPDLAWFAEQLAPNVSSNPTDIILANFSVGWYRLQTGEQNTYACQGGHFLTPLTAQQSAGTLTINNPAPSTFEKGARSPSSNPQTVQIESVPAGTILVGLSDPTSYSQIVTPILGPGQPTLAILTGAHAWIIPATALPTTSGYAPSPWTITSAQTINTNGGTLVVKAPVSGAGGIVKTGEGMLQFANTNALTGLMSVTAGTLASSLPSGTPFGSGAMSLSGGGLLVFPPDGDAAIASANDCNVSFGAGGGTLQLGGQATCTVTIGGYVDGKTPNLNRLTAGTLVIAPGSGLAELGSSKGQQVVVAGSGDNLPVTSNGIVAPYIVGQDNDGAGSGGFLAYNSDNSGFQAAVAVSSAKVGIGKVKGDMVYEVIGDQTIEGSGKATVAALEMNGGSIYGPDGTIVVGSQQAGDVAGLIMNGGNIAAGTLVFGASEGVIYTNNGELSTAIESTIEGSAGLTVFGPGQLALGGDNSTTLSGPITVNSGTLSVQNSQASAAGGGDVTVWSGAVLQVIGIIAGAVDVEQSGTLSLAGGTIQGSVSIADIGQTTAEPGGILQGGGTIAGTAEIGGVIQCGPEVGLITFANSVVISSDSAFYWQLQGQYDNTNSQPGTGWNALEFQSTSSTVGSSTESVRVFLDFSVMGGDPDTANQSFWANAHTWTLATFPAGTSPSCWVEHGNFVYNSGCFCVCVQDSSLNLLWQPGATSANWCTSNS
jgi:autotransporter-associated beta strand protein